MWTDGEAQAGFAAETKASLAVLDAELQGHGTRFFGGDDLGFVDLAACTLAHWLGVLEEVAGVTVLGGDEEYPALRRWGREYLADEAVRACLPDRDQLLAHFSAIRDKCISVAKSMLPN